MPPRGKLTVRRIRTLRWVFLGAAAALALVLAVLWWAGRSSKPEEPPTTEEATNGAQQVGKGFDHTVTHEGRPLLRIRGKRDRRDKEGDLHVDEVLITAYQDDGSKYEVTSDTAVYSLDQREALLQGKVNLVGPDGFHLQTTELRLRQGGRWLNANQLVQLQYGIDNPIFGRAQELDAQVNRGQFFLSGGVHLHTEKKGEEDPFRMNAKRVIFEREMHQLRAEGEVQLLWGQSSLAADRVAAHLEPQTNKLQFVRARWQVKAVFYDQDEQGHKRIMLGEGDDLSALLDDQGKKPTRLELQGDGKKPAHLNRVVEAGDIFDLLAPDVSANLSNGHMTDAAADGGVEVNNQPPQGAPRKLTARTANATFASGGGLAQLELHGNVKAAQPGQGTVEADRAVVTPDRTEAFGEPVVVVSQRGEMRAPRVVYTKDGGTVHGVGGIEGTMLPDKGSAMRKTPLAESDQPVHVQAEEAFWSDPDRTFLFKGKVRAWSGDRVVRSEQLRGDDRNQQLAGAGNVETVWFMPPPEHPQPGQPTGPQQVRVNADTLSYSDKAHQLIYEGNVKVVEGQRTLKARTVTVDLTEKGQAKHMLASNEVSLQAPAEGRSITNADTADYDVDGQTVLFKGNPVTMKDQKGGTLTGKQAVYSMATGKVRVSAEEPASGEGAKPEGEKP
jgi:LPS export ABC transporter protein LptC/lipopolysaccharide transport protein LptA